LIFKLPSGTGSQKSVVADAANLADILPTVLEIIGASSLKEVQGRSLVSSIAGKPTTTEAENYAETYLPRIHFNWSDCAACVSGSTILSTRRDPNCMTLPRTRTN